MNNKVFLKILLITITLAFTDILIFSPGIFAISYITNPILFIISIIVNIGILVGEIIYITHSNTAKYGYDLDKLKDTDDYKQALEACYTKKSPLEKEIKQAITQTTSITKKRKVLQELLEQNNKEHYTALYDLGEQASTYLVGNIRKILNRIAIYDADTNDDLLESHKIYINKLLDSNENILSQFNRLLTEVSQMDDTKTDESLSSVLDDMTQSLKQLRGIDS